MTRLSEKQKELCERPVSKDEIWRSIKEFSNGCTPGTDGLLADWYKCFWIEIKSTLTNSIIYALNNEHCQSNRKEASQHYYIKRTKMD